MKYHQSASASLKYSLMTNFASYWKMISMRAGRGDTSLRNSNSDQMLTDTSSSASTMNEQLKGTSNLCSKVTNHFNNQSSLSLSTITRHRLSSTLVNGVFLVGQMVAALKNHPFSGTPST
eukprot:CAMPEP_0202978658 /NCGR_PEP_ID=MMETSP1396-20130829/85009_1 /ASSEMBLY_ACC=CAM_ASM_000872 /TAXON_ID= /ORGANISM="Pseudokeronopsis sp., Strain Brazil" /LENGTH=119 /DNA_ID=CAMNT_0049717709 /DNA_START=1218 /DNA_END=1577 /DNA_ORIENTATION=-